MQPDPSPILDKLSIETPLLGFYDAPDPTPFSPLVEPEGRFCVFAAYQPWLEGKTLHLTPETPGCGGVLTHLFARDTWPREEFVRFLCDTEGLKATHELMNLWLDQAPHYLPRHDHLLLGPLREEQYAYLQTVTFIVNPDQLSILSAGTFYYQRPEDPVAVSAPYGSGCMELAALFEDLDAPQAIIGATDQAMRRYLPPDLLAFSATKPMFERLCLWAKDPRSSLHKGFLEDLLQARGGSLHT